MISGALHSRLDLLDSSQIQREQIQEFQHMQIQIQICCKGAPQNNEMKYMYRRAYSPFSPRSISMQSLDLIACQYRQLRPQILPPPKQFQTNRSLRLLISLAVSAFGAALHSSETTPNTGQQPHSNVYQYHRASRANEDQLWSHTFLLMLLCAMEEPL